MIKANTEPGFIEGYAAAVKAAATSYIKHCDHLHTCSILQRECAQCDKLKDFYHDLLNMNLSKDD